MEMRYRVNENDYSLENVTFAGLTGHEYVVSTKDALNVMKIQNPATQFSADAKAGYYDKFSDEEYEEILAAIKCVSSLWHYPGEPKDCQAQYEMNILTLLANAIELISQQNTELREYRGE